MESGLEAPPSRLASSSENSPCLGAVAAGEDGCPLPALQLLRALWGGLPDSLGYGDSAHLTPAAAELWPWGAFVGTAPESHLMSGAFPGDLRAAVNCINLPSLGFCPSTCSRNLAEFFAFPCLSCFCRGKAELFDNNLLLDARLKP